MDKKNNINDKNAPNLMRVMMKRVREGKYTPETNEQIPEKNLDVRDMLKITRSINEDANDRTQLSGEKLLRSNFNHLTSDLEFNKLAQSYENYLRLRRKNFHPSDVIERALSSARDLIAEYLQQVKGLDVTGEDVQNFFQGMITKFKSVVGEETLSESENKKTVYDQSLEEEKFRNFFNDMNVSIKLIDLEIYDNLVFWGGTIDGVIQFIYKVTPDESTSGIEFNYLEDFSPDNPENEEITGRIESYFDTFYKYWRDNVLSAGEVVKDEKSTSQSEPDKEQDL